MDDITYVIEDSGGKYTSTIKAFGTPIKYIINGSSYKQTQKISEAYIKKVKVIKNTCKGMQGYFFIQDFDGEHMYFSESLKLQL
jgi:hypothetical protein